MNAWLNYIWITLFEQPTSNPDTGGNFVWLFGVWLSKITSKNKAQVSTWLKNHWPLNGWIPNTQNVRIYIYMYMYIYFSNFHIYNVRPSLRDPHHSQVWMLPSCLRAALLRNTLRIKSIKFKKHCSISNPSSEMVLLHCESGNLNHLK